jgi:hypothetical protein
MNGAVPLDQHVELIKGMSTLSMDKEDRGSFESF